MAATGFDVFDKTLQTTNIWLDEMMEVIGPDRQVAWHTLGAVLRSLRDRLPLGLGLPHISAHNCRSLCAVSITINGNPKSNLTKHGPWKNFSSGSAISSKTSDR